MWSAVSVAAQAPPDPPRQFTVSQVRVIEADTLEVSVRGARVGVRIPGIRVPRGNTECGRRASALVQEILSSGAWLGEETRLPLLDKGWLRRYRVTTADGRSVAAELARAGLAVANSREADAVDFPEIAANEADAQNTARGCVAAAAAAELSR